ncbi:restriction endonuclease subunit S [Methanomethylophilus alvi]|uniref:restriction endonuclease subunit S n=1 Tax=Methanomethylophilus alvi TaxID=1291540 RepID=UPI0037DC7751
MAIKGSGSPMETVDEYFDMLIKSRFIEMFEDQNYQLIRLGDILKQNTTVTKVDCPDKETFVTLSSKGRGAKKREIKDGKTPVAFSGYRIHAGQFIYSRIDARNAAFDIVPECLEGAVVSKDFPVFDFDTNAIEPVYLLHSVLQNSFIEQIQSSSFGATNRQRIKEETMMNYSIVLPPLSKQREYSQFVQLTIIIKKHYQQLMDSFDILVKSRFIEMFGSLKTNEKGWDVKTISDVCSSIVRGPFGSSLRKDMFVPESDTSVKVYEQKHAIQKEYNIGSYYVTKEKYEELKRFECGPGDFIMSCSGTMGELYQLPDTAPNGIINQALCKFTLNDLIHPCFFKEYMSEMVSELDSKGSAIKNIAAVKFVKNMLVPLPSIDLQNRFADFVKQVDKSKFVETVEPDHPAVFQNIHGFPSFGLIST